MIFQFTPLREGRRSLLVHKNARAAISIHAPPRGATRPQRPLRRSTIRFQFTPLREGRRGKSTQDGTPLPFQFTPLREGRRAGRRGSRARPISIHAPPRGATSDEPRRHPEMPYFNSRPSARGDCMIFSAVVYWYISIHAPPRGATRDFYHIGLMGKISIHAPPRGATRAS